MAIRICVFLFSLLHLLALLLRPSSASSDLVLVDCGARGTSADADGRLWSGDEGSRFLSPSSSSGSSVSSSPLLPVPFSTARVSRSPFTYSFPLAHDRYFLRLHFHAFDHADFPAADASFDVVAGRHALLRGFKPYATVKMQEMQDTVYIIREYSLNVSSSSGWLNLTFTPSPGGHASVNGIELVPMPDLFISKSSDIIVGTSVPYHLDPFMAVETMHRLNVGGTTIPRGSDSGHLYRKWSDDSDYIVGDPRFIAFSKDANVSISYPPGVPKHIAPEGVYATARSMPWYAGDANLYHNLSWALKVDPGFYYLVRFHFCEIQHLFTLTNQRVFTIYLNNMTFLQDMDVIVYAGGIGVPVYLDAVTVPIPGTDRSSQVDLFVSLHPYVKFKPQYTNVILNGLEVFKLNDFYGSLAGPQPAGANRSFAAGHRQSRSGLLPVATWVLCAVAAAAALTSLVTYLLHDHLNRRGCSFDAKNAAGASAGSGMTLDSAEVAWQKGGDDPVKQALI